MVAVMEEFDEVSRRELFALREIRSIGRTTDHPMVIQLLNDDLIIKAQDNCFQLSAKGRRMLVRGSPFLWNIAS